MCTIFPSRPSPHFKMILLHAIQVSDWCFFFSLLWPSVWDKLLPVFCHPSLWPFSIEKALRLSYNPTCDPPPPHCAVPPHPALPWVDRRLQVLLRVQICTYFEKSRISENIINILLHYKIKRNRAQHADVKEANLHPIVVRK